jgi:hypothetical protein
LINQDAGENPTQQEKPGQSQLGDPKQFKKTQPNENRHGRHECSGIRKEISLRVFGLFPYVSVFHGKNCDGPVFPDYGFCWVDFSKKKNATHPKNEAKDYD